MAKSFGKVFLGIVIIIVVGLVALFLYNRYAESVGNPTWQEAFRNATALTQQNEQLVLANQNLTSQVGNLTAENQFLSAAYPGVDKNYFWVMGGVVLFLLLLAYSIQARKGDINMSIEEFRKIVVPYAYDSFSILPSTGNLFLQQYLPDHLKEISRHPLHLTCTRYWEETAVIEGKTSTKYFIGCFTQGTAFGFKREVIEKTVRIAICSNDPNDISCFPAKSFAEVKKILTDNIKARNGIVSGASENELVTSLGQKVLSAAAAQQAPEGGERYVDQ